MNALFRNHEAEFLGASSSFRLVNRSISEFQMHFSKECRRKVQIVELLCVPWKLVSASALFGG